VTVNNLPNVLPDMRKQSLGTTRRFPILD